ncbi:MAG: flavodoxin family protein [Candidatus Burarchaeum sp.]|nr:flavodoxin family protein [Candidatus Burarchaeum sp.]MDO8340106.1 flavodoxin family protein [Candidatus Burarchaeum sp.]
MKLPSLKAVAISATNRAPEAKDESHTEAALKDVLGLMAADGAQTKFICVSDLKIHTCEGNYSKNPKLCTWPCQSSLKYKDDQMKLIYDALLESDIVLFGTPVRWNNCSSLMQKVIERLNCVENQYSIFNKRLIKDKVAGVVVIGHEDGAQHVGGNLLNFLTFMGFHLPPFAIAYWVGESKEDGELDAERISRSKFFAGMKKDLAAECVSLARLLKNGKSTR